MCGVEFQGHHQSCLDLGEGLCALSLAPHKQTLEERKGMVTCGWPAVTGGRGSHLCCAPLESKPGAGPCSLLFHLLHNLTALCRERYEVPQELCLRKETGKLRSLRVFGLQSPPHGCREHCLPQGAVKTGKRPDGQRGKPVSMQHQARLSGNKKKQKTRPYTHGLERQSWSASGLGCRPDSQCSTRSQRLKDLLLYECCSLDSQLC